MAKTECCRNCRYSYVDPFHMLVCMTTGWFARPACANHPDSLGRMRPVRGEGICRNYRPKPADPAKGAKQIPLGDGLYAYVDAADYEWLSQWKWHLINGYAGRWEKGKQVYMHREIMQPPAGMKVDHADRNKLDNTRDNLRVCTQRENILNQATKGGSASRFKGVEYRTYRSGRRKCYAEIRINGKKTYLGSFDEEADAARAYDRAAVEHHGEFGYLNFPDEWPRERRKEVHAKWLAENEKGDKPEGKSEKAKGRESKRQTHDARRTTKPRPRRTTGHESRATARKKPRVETQRRGGRKQKTKKPP